MNILFCSAGRRCELLKDFKKTMGNSGKIVAADISRTAPALYAADAFYLVPEITDAAYIPVILDICRKEKIQAVTTCIDPEIMILAEHREAFREAGAEVLAPYLETARLCFDKYKMYEYLQKCRIRTVLTFGDYESFEKAYKRGEIDFPVFIKPREGSGSVGVRKVEMAEVLKEALQKEPGLIIQEYMGNAQDLDVDVYVDLVSRQPVSMFSKRKLETKTGGASKTVSFKDENLEKFVCEALSCFQFYGPIDVDLWYRDGAYYLSEINPRFGGAYLHAYGAGVDFVKLIENNIEGIENERQFGNYEENVVMMMYDSVMIEKIEE